MQFWRPLEKPCVNLDIMKVGNVEGNESFGVTRDIPTSTINSTHVMLLQEMICLA